MDRIIHKRGQVAQENVDKVNAIIKEHGYKRNVFASNLAFNKKFVFAVLLPNYNHVEYWHKHVLGIQKAANEYASYGVEMRYFLYDYDAESFAKAAQEVLVSHHQGLLFAPVFIKESLDFLNKYNENINPVVLVDSNLKRNDAYGYFGQDAYKSGFLAGKLVSLNQKNVNRILVVKIARDIEATSAYLQRMEGFYDFFKENSTASKVEFKEIMLRDSDKEALNVTIFEGIDSVFVPNSRAYLIADFLEKNNIQDIRIIGYDLLEQNKNHLKKGGIDFLINQNPEIQGYTAITSLYKQLVLQESKMDSQYMPLEIIVKENVID
ncbi:substrate-binding domain-containing protein [Flavobacterium faecale]|uniref:substrate-binding domain-containing protein n=1 Tax=Flavobacterium faecale TaxID=1355330 RepID=UPI001FE33534|nr:substrate-binding domain-containing protein [Flavobacterium faecale]